MSKPEGKVSYEPEADVLTWEMSRTAPIVSAKEIGNVIVHFAEHNVPVLIEILNASSFLKQAELLLQQTKSAAAPSAAATT